MPRLILASASPRRQALVARFGLDVTIQPAELDETPLPGEPPAALAERLAEAKAAAVAGDAVLAADTVVVADGVALGKPESPATARSMLRSLRGRQHTVITGIAVRTAERAAVCSVASAVTMRDLSDAAIAAYVASGLPLDKAGAYGVQDAAHRPVAAVEGCYLNVVGLPMCVAGQEILNAGVLTARQPWFDARDWRKCELCQQEWPPR